MKNWITKGAHGSVALIMIALPISKALISIGAAAILFFAIAYFFSAKPKIQIQHLCLPFGLIVLCYVTSLIYSQDWQNGLKEINVQHGLLSIPMSIAILSKVLLPYRDRFIQLFTWSCFCHAALTLVLFALPEDTVASLVESVSLFQEYPDHIDRVKFGLYTPMIERLNFAYLIVFGILFLLYKIYDTGFSALYLIQLSILGLTTLLTGARGAQLALILVIGFGVMYYIIRSIHQSDLNQKNKLGKIAIYTILVLFSIGIVPYAAYQNVPSVKKRYDQMQWELRLINNGDYIKEEYQFFTMLTRIRAWKNGYAIVKHHPIFGVGLGDYRSTLETYNATYNDKVPTHNQNFFLYLWGATGICGLCAFIVGLVYCGRLFHRSKDIALATFLIAYLIFVVLTSMFDAYLKYQIGSMSVMIFLSLGLLGLRQSSDAISSD